MLSAKEIYNASIHNLARIEWEKVGGSEWLFVGDGLNFRREVLLGALKRVSPSGRVYVVINRNTVSEHSVQESVEIVWEHQASGRVLVCDKEFRRYVEVDRVGVFRFGVLPVNKSLQPQRT